MRSAICKLLVSVSLAYGLFVSPTPSEIYAQNQISLPEEVEWTWEVRPKHVNSGLPNVLLVGDSITRNYYPEVQRQLAAVANTYLFASSTSVGDPRLTQQLSEFSVMEAVPFKVIHFNNGMHGWTYSDPVYKAEFPSFLNSLHLIAPEASLIWATTTPVKVESLPGPTNARVMARNRIAQSFVEKAGIPIDDQYLLMSHHADQYEDNIHFSPSGAAIQALQVAQFIRLSLENQH